MNNIDTDSICYFFIPSLFLLHSVYHSLTPTSSLSVSHVLVSPFLLPRTFPFSFIAFLLCEGNSSSSMCQRARPVKQPEFLLDFLRAQRMCVCMNNTCGDPLTSPSLLKESISIPPFPILQALTPLSAHCNRLWGLRSPYHRPVEGD